MVRRYCTLDLSVFGETNFLKVFYRAEFSKQPELSQVTIAGYNSLYSIGETSRIIPCHWRNDIGTCSWWPIGEKCCSNSSLSSV